MGAASKAGKMEQHCRVAPEIEKDKCQKCGVCVYICPAGAIRKINGEFFIDPEKCIGCAQCVTVCRFSAIKIIWDEDTAELQRRLVEYVCGAVKGKRLALITFVDAITKDCDCLSKEKKGLVKDLGILASFDPVAIDAAAVEIVNRQFGSDFIHSIYPHINYHIQLDRAKELGIGNLNFQLILLTN
jgi:hypothetical protein